MLDSKSVVARVAANLADGEPAPHAVAARIADLRAGLSPGLEVLDSIVAGAYSRHTLIPPLRFANVDTLVVLSPTLFRADGWTSLLAQTKDALVRVHASRVELARDGRAVRIGFPDFAMHVIPGFYRQTGGFVIPDVARGRWLATDPVKHAEIWRDADRAHRGRLVPLIKMLRAWNCCNGSTLQSLHLEALALAIFANVTITDDVSGLRYFFDKARSAVLQPTPDPAGFGGDLADYLDDTEKMAAAAARVESAYASIVNAQQVEMLGKPKHAEAEWLNLFGRYLQPGEHPQAG